MRDCQHVRDRMRRWLKLLLGLFLIWGFAFVAAPLLERLAPVRAVHRCAQENQIDASALFYTDSDGFADAETYIRDSLRHRVVQEFEKLVVEAADVQETAGLVQNTDLQPGQHLEEFLERADAAGQCRPPPDHTTSAMPARPEPRGHQESLEAELSETACNCR